MSEQAVALHREGYVVGIDDAITPSKLLDQVRLIQTVMSSVMKENEHYGKIPGCGPKPTLLKPGAEKLCFTFRLDPEFDVEVIPIPHQIPGHREYRVKSTLYSIGSGNRIGSGVGSASTMENKWRFRTGPTESTGNPVPQEYWDLRKTDPEGAQKAIGGRGFVAKKGDSGTWEIFRQGEKVENENPADIYNTVLKMAKKRAMVDAVLTCTAASDIFTQDVEELVENEVIPVSVKTAVTEKSPPVSPEPPVSTNAETPPEDENTVRAELKALCEVMGVALGLDWTDVLYSLTVNKEGKFGEKDINKIRFTVKGPKGPWSPLKATLSKAKEQFKNMEG